MKKIFALLVFSILSCNLLLAQEYHWAPYKGESSGTMGSVFTITINGEIQQNLQLELGLFIGDVCKGRALMTIFPFTGEYIVDIETFGDAGDAYSVRLFDGSIGPDGKELDYLTCEESLSFSDDGYGNHFEPYPLHFTGSESTNYELPIDPYGNPDEKAGYYLISSPIGNVEASEVEGLMSYEYDFYRFDQAQEMEWINLHDGGTLQAGKGYLYANSGNTETGDGVTLNFIGTAYTGTGTFPLEYSEDNLSENMRGWNLVGNPFAEDATINMACYMMNGEGSELEPCNVGATVPAMHGAFVKATAEGQSVTFATNGSSDAGSKVVLNVMQNRGANIDRAIVSLNGNSSLPKFMLNPENTKIYIPQGGEDYAVVSSTDNELPVSFKAKENGTYTLKVAVENTEMYYLHLIDHIAGNDVDLLANPSYTFEANSGDFANRFTLVMSNTEGVDEHFAYYNGVGWTISNNGQATLQVIDMTGRVVNNTTIDGVTQLDINAAPGVYMLRLVNGNDVKVQKVVVR